MTTRSPALTALRNACLGLPGSAQLPLLVEISLMPSKTLHPPLCPRNSRLHVHLPPCSSSPTPPQAELPRGWTKACLVSSSRQLRLPFLCCRGPGGHLAGTQGPSMAELRCQSWRGPSAGPAPPLPFFLPDRPPQGSCGHRPLITPSACFPWAPLTIFFPSLLFSPLLFLLFRSSPP